MTDPERFSVTEDSIRVGVGEFGVSDEHPLVTFALGSCLGVAIYDSEVGVGGLLHAMLPRKRQYTAAEADSMYVDTGISALCRDIASFSGADLSRLRAKLVGGRQVDHRAVQPVGPLNIRVARDELKAQGIPVVSESISQTSPSSVIFTPTSGKLIIRTPEGTVRQI